MSAGMDTDIGSGSGVGAAPSLPERSALDRKLPAASLEDLASLSETAKAKSNAMHELNGHLATCERKLNIVQHLHGAALHRHPDKVHDLLTLSRTSCWSSLT